MQVLCNDKCQFLKLCENRAILDRYYLILAVVNIFEQLSCIFKT